jgi:hypothetical protein
MDELQRIVELHSHVRRLTEPELRAALNESFAQRDHHRTKAICWEIWRRQDAGR